MLYLCICACFYRLVLLLQANKRNKYDFMQRQNHCLLTLCFRCHIKYFRHENEPCWYSIKKWCWRYLSLFIHLSSHYLSSHYSSSHYVDTASGNGIEGIFHYSSKHYSSSHYVDTASGNGVGGIFHYSSSHYFDTSIGNGVEGIFQFSSSH